MKAVLKIECIGDSFLWAAKNISSQEFDRLHIKKRIELIRYGRRDLAVWVARLLDFSNDKFEYEFIECVKDYSDSNPSGNKQIYKYFALDPGIYEVNKSIRLGVPTRYFIRVENLEIIEITREEVIKCLTRDT